MVGIPIGVGDCGWLCAASVPRQRTQGRNCRQFGAQSLGNDAEDAWDQRRRREHGVAVDGSPTKRETRTPRVPDGTRRRVTVGLDNTPSENTSFDFGYGHIFLNDAHVDTTTATRNRLSGVYDSSGNLLGASAQFRF